jgi:ABC-type branched-subunit amino acid transport system ATPase component
MRMTEAILATRDLVAGYVPEVDILTGVTLDVADKQLVTVVGPNGAGKSTLIKTVMGLLTPRRGQVLLHGDEVAGSKPHVVARRNVGYVPQLANVFATMSVEENLELGCIAFRSVSKRRRMRELFEFFPRLAERRRQRAGTLSGGERQMVAMARALMPSPTLLLFDEPSAGLAPNLVDQMFDKIAEINESGVAILLVEQNARRALAMSHRGYVLDLGANRFEGTGQQLLDDPQVAELYLGGGRAAEPEEAEREIRAE